MQWVQQWRSWRANSYRFSHFWKFWSELHDTRALQQVWWKWATQFCSESRVGSATAFSGDETGESFGIAAPFLNQSNALQGTKGSNFDKVWQFYTTISGYDRPEGQKSEKLSEGVLVELLKAKLAVLGGLGSISCQSEHQQCIFWSVVRQRRGKRLRVSKVWEMLVQARCTDGGMAGRTLSGSFCAAMASIGRLSTWF